MFRKRGNAKGRTNDGVDYQALYEQERLAREEAEKKQNEERLAREEAEKKQQEAEKKQQEAERKENEERLAKEEVLRNVEQARIIDAAEYLDLPLEDVPDSTRAFLVPEINPDQVLEQRAKRSKSRSTSISGRNFTHRMPYSVTQWPEFENEMIALRTSLAGRQVLKPLEQQLANDLVFSDERAFPAFWANPRSATKNVLAQVFPDSPIGSGRAHAHSGGPGREDELFSVVAEQGEHEIYVLEQKDKHVLFETNTHLADIVAAGEPEFGTKLKKKYAVCSLVQTYTYMIQYKLRFGMFSNWDNWVFMKREQNDNRNEILRVSTWITRERARLAWATMVFLACQDLGELEPGSFGLVPQWIVTPRQDPAADQGNQGGGAGGPGGVGGAGDAGLAAAARAAYPDTTTEDALHVTALSLLTEYQLLGNTDKSHTRRVRVDGRDLVVKLVDFYGTPKHSEFSARELYDLEWNEVQTYHYLQQQNAQGRLAPRFLFHGSDFNQIWATAVTTYEGESLSNILKRTGSLTAEMRNGALASLRELHSIGVLHGDIALRNAVWREEDRRVVWVDFEFSQLRTEVDGTECFDSRANEEVHELDMLFAEASRLPENETQPLPCDDRTLESDVRVADNKRHKTVTQQHSRLLASCKICPCL